MAEDSTAQFQLPGETESWDVGNGFSAAEDKQPSHTQSSEHQHQEAYSVDRSHVVSGDAPDDGADDSAEYDPESLSTMDDADDTHRLIAPPATAPAPATDSQHAPKAAKTVSGFVVDSDDDEEDVDTAAKAIPPAPSGAQGAQSKTTLSSSNVPQETVLVPQPTHSVSAPPVEKSSVSGMVPPGAQPVAPVLAEDNIAFLERRVQKDPRGEVDAWLELMREHRARNQYDELRRVYERFLEIFPHSAEIWVESVNFELNIDNFAKAEDIFRQCLMTVPSVSLWTTYLDYIRRRNDLSDPTGQARQVITQAYEFVLSNVGIDKESGKLWQDYIQFIRNGPGQIGGSSWQDQQKMDLLRKTYQRALAVPTACLQAIWKEYDAFEMGLNKMTGRKFLQERSPGYMTARSANTTLENATRGLVRTSIPRLPPAKGFAGDDEYMEQVECWKRWVAWEKDDPLSIRSEDAQGFQRRVLHCYKQALMALRFWPDMWVDAAEWCFENNLVEPKDMGMEFLNEGIKANPESVLLALKLADRLEMTSPIEEGEAAKVERGKLVRAPYDTLLDTLYEMLKQLKEREEQDVKKIEQDDIPFLPPPPPNPNAADDDDDANDADKAKNDAKKQLIDHVKKGIAVQTDLLKRTVTFVWIALFRAMRRVQGKGQPKGPGARGIFQEARARGRLTSDIYAAIAKVEWNVYKDASSTKIFDRGAKLFPTDEHLILDYLKHLHSQHDTTNARVVFETFVNKVTQNPELVYKAKPIYLYFHKYESYYGELSHIAKLEKRMTELFPDDPKLSHFASRFSNSEEYGVDSFDPLSVRLIISPAAQMKPKTLIMPSIEPAQSVRSMSRPISRDGFSPRPQMLPAVNSPKRALEDFDDSSRPRKIVRGESPLKGAAGRRLDQQRRNQGGASTSGVQPLPISRDITFLLGLIPPASTYNARPYAPHRVVKLLQDTPLPSFQEWKASQNQDKSSRQMPTHNRQQSTEYPGYPTYGQPGRNSPVSSGPGGSRPMSPYDANMRRGVAPIVPASATYRNSPLRPETGGYDPPPASYPPPPAGYGSAPTLIDSSTSWGYAPPPPAQGGSYPPQTQYPPRYHY